MEITSTQNETIKHFCKLSVDSSLRFRSKSFLIEGKRLVCDAIIHNVKIETVFVLKEKLEEYDFLDDLKETKIIKINEAVNKKLSQTVNPQGIFAVCKINDDINLENAKNIIILDNVSDSGNVGAIIRSCACFGIDSVIGVGSADFYNPKTIRSTAGGIFDIPLLTFLNILEATKFLKEKGFKIFCTNLNEKSSNISNMKLSEKNAFIIGNEANGISAESIQNADENIYIETKGDKRSLNAAVAASIIIYKVTQ